MPMHDPRTGLTCRQELFARGLSLGKTQADALRLAYPKSQNWLPATVHERASRLARLPAVQERVATLTAIVRYRSGYTRDEAFRDAHDALQFARSAQDMRAMLMAIMLKAKLAGLIAAR